MVIRDLFRSDAPPGVGCSLHAPEIVRLRDTAGMSRLSPGPTEFDARGLPSPLPVLRAHRMLRGMEAGQMLRVVTTQALSVAEFQSLARHVPHYELVSQESGDGEYVHLLRKRR